MKTKQVESVKKPYIFISYAHLDSDEVVPVINALRERGYNVWYDDGIRPGTEWAKTIADHLRECTCMVAFVSDNYAKSKNCTREVTYAQNNGKPIFSAFLDIDVNELPSGIDMQLGDSQAIMLKRYKSLAEFAEAICNAPFFEEAGCTPGKGSEDADIKEMFKKSKRKSVLNFVLVVMELFYMYFGITAFQNMLPDVGGMFLIAVGRMVIPHLMIILLGNIIIRVAGKTLSHEQRSDIMTNCVMALFLGVFVCFIAGIFVTPVEAGFFARLFASFIINLLAGLIAVVPLCAYDYK